MKMKFKLSFLWASLFLLLNSCDNNNNSAPLDTPTSGSISICADETFKPIIDSEITVFEALYKKAHIHVQYLPEAECFKVLMKDSARVILVTRKISVEEKKYFNDQKYFPVETPIATDAVAVIVNNKNADSLLNYTQLKAILLGEIKEWKKISVGSKLSNIQIVFDNAQSSTLRYIKDSIIHTNNLPDNIFAAKTNQEVIDYVMKNENAIGFIGANWCKDLTDSTNMSFTTKIKVVGINPEKHVDVDFPQPYQSYMALQWYPLCRQIFTINREPRTGLGTGFVNFLAGDVGQRIILKGGLLPKNMPMRIVQVKKKF